MRYLIASLVGVAATVAVVAVGGLAEDSSAEQVEERPLCEVYDQAMDDIAEARFPGSRDPVLLAKKTGGVPPIGYLVSAPVHDLDWECEDRRLTVTVRGPWTLGATDTEAALEVLLEGLRERGLRPEVDEVVISLESLLMDESALFDGAQVMRDLMKSLAREAGFREPSVFDTYDYGPFPPLWLMPSPVVPVVPVSLEDAEDSQE